MSIIKTIVKNDDVYSIKYTYPQAEDGSVRVDHKGSYTMSQIDDRITLLESELADWFDNKQKCQEII